MFVVSSIILSMLLKSNKKIEDRKTNADVFDDNWKKLYSFMDQKFQDQSSALNRNQLDSQNSLNDRFESLRQTLDKSIDDKMSNVNTTVKNSLEEGFTKNKDHLEKVNQALGKITESQRNIDALNEQVTTLNGVLSNSQTRGRFGEIQLEAILKNSFGETHDLYDTQYVIKENKSRPDAVLFKPQNGKKLLLCIDSKFSFTEYEELMEEDPRKLDDSRITHLKQ